MKKILFVVMAAMLFVFSVASAQETAVEEQTLNFDSIGE